MTAPSASLPPLPDDGSRVAVASSPHPTHVVDVADSWERGVASLAEHRDDLAALDDRPVEEQAREIVLAGVGRPGGPAPVPFEVFA